MLACGHEKAAFGWPMCAHLRACRKPWIYYVKWYVGSQLDVELLCSACAEERKAGRQVPAELVCQECYEYATTEVGDVVGARGTPQICHRAEPFDLTLRTAALPKEVGAVVDIAPVDRSGRSIWLLLAADGRLIR